MIKGRLLGRRCKVSESAQRAGGRTIYEREGSYRLRPRRDPGAFDVLSVVSGKAN